jgi:catechol 2,3-dioxygenase-like lactoylglutathione lyase family enzyme
MQMRAAIPALPVRNVELSIPFYRDVLGLTMRHQDGGFAIFHQDTVEIHLWQADDESWRTRTNSEPVCSGAESFIAGTASCRVAMSGVDVYPVATTQCHSSKRPYQYYGLGHA